MFSKGESKSWEWAPQPIGISALLVGASAVSELSSEAPRVCM